MAKKETKNLPDMVFTVEETADILRCSGQYVYKLIDTGLLKRLMLGHMKIRKSTLEAFLEKWDGWDLSNPYHPVKLEECSNEEIA